MVEEKSSDLFERVKEALPKEAKISNIGFEGCEIVLYTKNKEFFGEPGDSIKNMVGVIKKRILLRPDPSICLDPEEAEKIIKETIPEEGGIKDIEFEPAFGSVTIEAEKPGIVIGRGGETLKELRKKIFWTPIVKRAPIIPSDIVKTLRELIYKESDFRREFLNKVGKSIHSGWKPTEWARLTALGAFREVGRSALLLQTPESSVLMDCGVKPTTNEFPYLSVPEFNIHDLDAIVLTHTHMDHAGGIPLLYEMGCEAPIYCTTPTRDLMVLLCMDYIKLCQREGRTAPYSTKGIKEAIKRCIPLDYGQVSDITPDIRLTLANSGHILGGALAHFHIGSGFHNLLYSGDLKFDRTALFDPASTDFARVETFITEATYGFPEDIQPRRAETEALLVNTVKKTLERGGKVLIPSFAVERSQDVQVILAKAGIETPIYLDGMIWDSSAIHTAYPEFFGRELQKLILQQGWNPFTQEVFKRIGSEDERKALIESRDPAVIISTSGMMVGGPVLTYFRNLADDKKNTLVFVGYQSENSLGRKIQNGWKSVPMEDKGKNVSVNVNMDVVTISGLSGHSDYKQLLNFIGRLRQNPEKVIVNHGEAEKCLSLAHSVHKYFRSESVAPKLLETLRLK